MKLARYEVLGQAAAHVRQHKVAVWRPRRPPDQRQTIAPLGPVLLPLATRDPAVSERHPLPAPSPERYQNHAPLQPRTPSYVDADGQLPDP